MSLGYLSAVNTTQVRAPQMSLQALAQNRNWPAVNPGRTDGIVDAPTAQAVFTVISGAPYIPDSVKMALRIGFILPSGVRTFPSTTSFERELPSWNR